MIRKPWLLTLFSALFVIQTIGQELEGFWLLRYEEDGLSISNTPIDKNNYFFLGQGILSYCLNDKENTCGLGSYTVLNDTVYFRNNASNGAFTKYGVEWIDENQLNLHQGEIIYRLHRFPNPDPKQELCGTWQLRQIKNDGQYLDGLSAIESDSSGNQRLILNSDGSYIKVLPKFTSGYWLDNQYLLLLKQKTPQVLDEQFQLVQVKGDSLLLKQGNRIYTFISDKHPDYVTTPSNLSLDIMKSQGFSLNGLLRGILGMVVLLFTAFILSKNRKGINWKTVIIGLGAQLLLAIGVLRISWVKSGFEAVGQIFVNILDYTKAGSEFLFSGFMDANTYGFIFVFQILPTIIFFSALTSLLFYLGLIQFVVKGLAWLMTKFLKISGAESLSVAGNIFLGQTEAPLMIKAYLERMTRSEILLVMIGGMATVAGGVLAAYIGFLGGDDPLLRLQFAKHLLAASVMAAPGAVVIAKILYPQTEKIDTNISVSMDKIGSNVLDAIANGTTEGLKLAANVAAMLLVFIALIAMINGILNGIGEMTHLNEWIGAHSSYSGLSLETILGAIFAPIMWLIGVASEDSMMMGQLLGVKLVASEFVGYIQLAELKNSANALHLTYEKSVIMATYMLCGFANFASIGIQIGGIGSLAPGQRKTLSQFGMKAVIGGTLASLLSATMAGMIIG